MGAAAVPAPYSIYVDICIENLSANTCVYVTDMLYGSRYDRTVAYNRRTGDLAPWGDGRNHGMVPLVRSSTGALISGAPQMEAPAPVGRPDPSSAMANGLRSTDAGLTWQPLHQLGHFGVCGYDLTVLSNGWIAHTAVIYVSFNALRTMIV